MRTVLLLVVPLLTLGCEGVSRDEHIEFFPTIGWQVDNGAAWELEIHGWVYESQRRWLLALIREALEEKYPEVEANQDLFSQRAGHFLFDSDGGVSMRIWFGDHAYPLPRTSGGGHVIGRIRLPAAEVARLRRASTTRPARPARLDAESSHRIAYRAAMPPTDPRVFEGEVHLIEPEGLSVISDIDDTIRFTGVGDRHAVFLSTFCRPFRAVPGMADLYQSWARECDACFHYVSTSPWQLHGPLTAFLHEAGFPEGTLQLRQFRWQTVNIFNPFPARAEPHKNEELTKLFERFPRRRFVLVGDASERDPEIYAAFARRYPAQVLRICIRDAVGAIDSPRYRDAFHDLSAGLTIVFREPQELKDAILDNAKGP